MDKPPLTHTGHISHDDAIQKAADEFEKYRIERYKKMVSDFDLAVKELEKKKHQ